MTEYKLRLFAMGLEAVVIANQGEDLFILGPKTDPGGTMAHVPILAWDRHNMAFQSGDGISSASGLHAECLVSTLNIGATRVSMSGGNPGKIVPAGTPNLKPDPNSPTDERHPRMARLSTSRNHRWMVEPHQLGLPPLDRTLWTGGDKLDPRLQMRFHLKGVQAQLKTYSFATWKVADQQVAIVAFSDHQPGPNELVPRRMVADVLEVEVPLPANSHVKFSDEDGTALLDFIPTGTVEMLVANLPVSPPAIPADAPVVIPHFDCYHPLYSQAIAPDAVAVRAWAVPGPDNSDFNPAQRRDPEVLSTGVKHADSSIQEEKGVSTRSTRAQPLCLPIGCGSC